MANSFYWHDYETFGVDPSRDRPSQFAGLRTDQDLNPIGESLVIYCQPQKDILPSPAACLITGITPQLALEKGLPEPTFIDLIHRELSQPMTCGLVTIVFVLMMRLAAIVFIGIFMIPTNENGKMAIHGGIF